MKRCAHCKQLKEKSEFTKDSRRRDRKNIFCKSCIKDKQRQSKDKIKSYVDQYYRDNKVRLSALQKQRRIDNPTTTSLIGRRGRLKYNYGITLDEYNLLFSKQGGECAICGKHQSLLKRSLYVDHNHVTGKIRGLLCHNCNVGIGMLQDSKDVVSRALSYLEE